MEPTEKPPARPRARKPYLIASKRKAETEKAVATGDMPKGLKRLLLALARS